MKIEADHNPCRRCGDTRRHREPSGRVECVTCRPLNDRKWYVANRQNHPDWQKKNSQRAKAWRAKNREHARKYARAWYLENRA